MLPIVCDAAFADMALHTLTQPDNEKVRTRKLIRMALRRRITVLVFADSVPSAGETLKFVVADDSIETKFRSKSSLKELLEGFALD